MSIPPKIKGLLFDKDGTLIDFNHTWLPLYKQAATLLAQRSSRELSADDLLLAGGYRAEFDSWQADSVLASGSNRQIFEHWQVLTGLSIDNALQDELSQIFANGKHRGIATVADLPDFFSQLQERNYKIGVATMDDAANAHTTLQALGVTDLVDFVCGADSGYGVKPEAGMIHAFCRQCNLAAAEVAMVGDSPRDLQMGINAGTGCNVGVLTGASSRAALSPLATTVLPGIAELPSLLTGQMARPD